MESTVRINDINYTLSDLAADTWQQLVRGAADGKHPFHTPVLGTGGAGGIHLRTLVLRQVNATDRQLICYSDLRTVKVHDIAVQPRVSWLFWHPRQKLQLRLRGQVTLHGPGDPVAQAHWARVPPAGRKDYMALQPPGSALGTPSQGLPPGLEGALPDEVASQSGQANFAVLITRVDYIDWLWLRREGHRRAQFHYEGNALRATWVVP